MRSFIVLLILILQSTFLALPACADDAPASAGAITKPPSLQGSVEHSESMSPVPDGMMPGAKFDERLKQKFIPGNVWYPIPAWMAGTWQYRTETVTQIESFGETEVPKVPFVLKNEFQRTFGFQKDKSGQVWDYLKAPSSYTTKLDFGLIGINNTTRIDIIKDEPTEVIRLVIGPDSLIDPQTNQIMKTSQKECFNRYTQYGDDAIFMDSSMKMFDMNGRPLVQKLSNMLIQRAKPFEVIDEKDGQNLKQMFAEYLRAQNKADLIP